MNWQEQAMQARHTPPEWAHKLVARLGLPMVDGQWHYVNPLQWRYAVDGYVFVLRKLHTEDENSIFAPWAVMEHTCLTCGKTRASTGLKDQAGLGAVLAEWPPVCSCQQGGG